MIKNSMISRFPGEEVERLAGDLYGIDGSVDVEPLDSYIDQNFLITQTKGNEKNRFVFKIANPNEIKAILEAENRVMEHLAAHQDAVKCPRVCTTREGNQITEVKSRGGTTCLVRMLTYLPGTFWAELNDHPPELLEHLGHVLGSIDKALETFSHPALFRYLRWDLKNLVGLESYVEDIRDFRQRHLVRYFLQQFKTFVIPAFPGLRCGVIYNDANDYNLLVGGDGKQVTGIIDFGDIVHTYTIGELAIATAYAIHGSDDPIGAAARIAAGYHKVYPLTEREVEVLFHLVCARLCATLLISAYQLKQDPANEYLEVSVKPAVEALEKLITINPGQACRVFRQACQMPEIPGSRELIPGEILKIRGRYLGKSLSVSYKKPLKIVRGSMQYLYDHTGRAFLDTVNNVCHVGHCHPVVVKAGQEQMAVLNTNTRYLHDNIVEYARRLADLLPGPLRVCFFVNSGSEANELALRLARTYTGNTDFIVIDHAYHGNTNAVIDISPYKFAGPGGSGAPPHVHKAIIPDCYRGPYKYDDPDAGEKYARDVRRIGSELKRHGKRPAAFIHESVMSVAGQIFFPAGYLKESYQYARELGAVCIADEVQVGFGRVGTHMWAFETQGVVPDIVTLGKPIGNGHPLGAVITTPRIADVFNNGMEYFNTFGGNPVSCAIGLAVLDVIRDEKLQENALKVGQYLKNRLEQLMERHSLIGDVRGMGLFIGIELVLDRETLAPAVDQAYYIAERMKEEGILTSVDGPLYNVLKFKPPMVFSETNADLYVDTMSEILAKIF
jgi:4-aminobutyrate aminotransferase-like enzyme/Ser/Thr protein kinase RdoA (MazF antagonist)